MSHVYSRASSLEKTQKVGDGNCVALVQHFTRVGHTIGWSPESRVMDQLFIWPGTAIATFDENGRYPNMPHGNHAALFLRFGPRSQTTGKPMYIVVMDQWKSKTTVHARTIYPRGEKSRRKGNVYDDSDNADMFWVIK